MSKPSVVVLSRIAGLRQAFDARSLAGPWIEWLSGDPTAPEAQAALERCEQSERHGVALGEGVWG